MEHFIQATAGVLIAVILGITLKRQGSESTLLLTVAVCCMVGGIALEYLKPVIDFVGKLRKTANLDSDMLTILFKVIGIGFLAEVCGMVCNDAGNSSLCKVLQFLASAVVLWISMPLFEQLLDLVSGILGEV